MKSPVEMFVQQYKAAAAEGAAVELLERLLADKTPELQSMAHDQELRDVEGLIIQHFAAHLSETERDTLTQCRQLRNKILHCEFRAARQKLAQGGDEPGRGDVKRIDIRGLSGPEMIEKIQAVQQGQPGSFELVADAPAGPGTVLAWLMELGAAGDFTLAAQVFARGAAILDRLARL